MPKAQRSVLGRGELHLITSTSYRRQAKLSVEKHRDLLCQLFEELRIKFRFDVVGYVVMPTYFQVLLSEPERESAEEVMLTLRQRFQRRYNVSVRSEEPAWEKGMQDVHVVTPDQIVGALTQMHEAPVKAELAETPTDWEWSSARRYAGLPEGVVTLEPSPDPRVQIAGSKEA